MDEGEDPEARDLHEVHQRNADHVFNTAVSLRGMLGAQIRDVCVFKL